MSVVASTSYNAASAVTFRSTLQSTDTRGRVPSTSFYFSSSISAFNHIKIFYGIFSFCPTNSHRLRNRTTDMVDKHKVFPLPVSLFFCSTHLAACLVESHWDRFMFRTLIMWPLKSTARRPVFVQNPESRNCSSKLHCWQNTATGTTTTTTINTLFHFSANTSTPAHTITLFALQRKWGRRRWWWWFKVCRGRLDSWELYGSVEDVQGRNETRRRSP